MQQSVHAGSSLCSHTSCFLLEAGTWQKQQRITDLVISVLVIKDKHRAMQGGKLLTWAALGYGVFHILFLLWMRPSILDFITWVAVGGGIGAAGAYGFYQTKHFKRQLNAGVI